MNRERYKPDGGAEAAVGLGQYFEWHKHTGCHVTDIDEVICSCNQLELTAQGVPVALLELVMANYPPGDDDFLKSITHRMSTWCTSKGLKTLAKASDIPLYAVVFTKGDISKFWVSRIIPVTHVGWIQMSQSEYGNFLRNARQWLTQDK